MAGKATKTSVAGVFKTDHNSYWVRFAKSCGTFDSFADAKSMIEKVTAAVDGVLPKPEKKEKTAKAKTAKAPKLAKLAKTAKKAKAAKVAKKGKRTPKSEIPKSQQYIGTERPIAAATA